MVAIKVSVDSILAAAAVAVTSLRAGSRALHLLHHGTLGLSKSSAPLILTQSDLWNPVMAFSMAVRLGLEPSLIAIPKKNATLPSWMQKSGFRAGDEPVEPYSLSPYPKPKRLKLGESEENEKEDTEKTDSDSQISDEESIESILNDIETKQNLPLRSWKFPSLNLSLPSRFRWWKRPTEEETSKRHWFHHFVARVAPWSKSSFSEDHVAEIDVESMVHSRITLKSTTSSGEDQTTVADITAHCPEVFDELRQRSGVSPRSFFRSILQTGPFVSFQSNSKGAARSGGFFFFTRDGAYMIKTIKKDEARTFLRTILPKYYKYMSANGGVNAGRSLLTRFGGLYTVRLSPQRGNGGGSSAASQKSESQELIFVVMNSVFPVDSQEFIMERFDLKGSTVGRECLVEEQMKKGRNAILKDLNLQKEVQKVQLLNERISSSQRGSYTPPSQTYGINIGPRAKAELLSQLRKDVRLLVECGVMDYSLLIGIVDISEHGETLNDARGSSSAQIVSNVDERQRRWLFNAKRTSSDVNHIKEIGQLLLAPLLDYVRTLFAPPIFIGKKTVSLTQNILSSILTFPLPYYGADVCGVDAGSLSVMYGTRHGHRAMYYMGLIDFMQPWTRKKILERQLKGVLGYDTKAISCVSPKEYASRLLDFLNANIT